jgi:hypothetical protein
MRPEITSFLRQDTSAKAGLADSIAQMQRIAEKL